MKLETDRMVNANASAVLQAGEAAIRDGDSSFDLSSVQRCDSAAVAVLLAWQRTAHACGRPLVLRGIPPSLHSLATLYGVDSLIVGVDLAV